MKKVEILRTYLPTETLGTLNVIEDNQIIFSCKTMELPWKDNAHQISCIPEGEYTVIRELDSPKHHYPHFRVLDVSGRSGILWHRITYVSGLLGCIGIGGSFKDLNNDKVPDIIESSITLQKVFDILPDKFQLTIKKK